MGNPIFYAVAYAFIVNKDNEILLQKRSKNCWYMPNTWSIPSWHIEKKEWILNAMNRELYEELWITAKPEDMEIVTNTFYYNSKTNLDYIWYYITINKFEWEIKIMEPDKCDWYKYVKYDEIPFDNMPPEVAFSLKKYIEWHKFNELFL